MVERIDKLERNLKERMEGSGREKVRRLEIKVKKLEREREVRAGDKIEGGVKERMGRRDGASDEKEGKEEEEKKFGF